MHNLDSRRAHGPSLDLYARWLCSGLFLSLIGSALWPVGEKSVRADHEAGAMKAAVPCYVDTYAVRLDIAYRYHGRRMPVFTIVNDPPKPAGSSMRNIVVKPIYDDVLRGDVQWDLSALPRGIEVDSVTVRYIASGYPPGALDDLRWTSIASPSLEKAAEAAAGGSFFHEAQLTVNWQPLR